MANPWQQSDRRPCLRLAFAVIFGLSFIATPAAQAQTFVTLYTFTGLSDGGNPYGSLIRDAKGNLYGTTYIGGASGQGTVFRLRGLKETVMYSFTGTHGDGSGPSAGVIRDEAGNLYGTTTYGGGPGCTNAGCGTVFKVDRAGKETVLYSFTGGADGAQPVAELIEDAAGNLYGTASTGGNPNCNRGAGCGVVFEIKP